MTTDASVLSGKPARRPFHCGTAGSGLDRGRQDPESSRRGARRHRRLSAVRERNYSVRESVSDGDRMTRIAIRTPVPRHCRICTIGRTRQGSRRPFRVDSTRVWQYGMAMAEPLISTSSDVLGGTPVFAKTRVPVQTLLDYLEAGDSIDEFLAGFPSVRRAQVVAFLEHAARLAVHNAA